MAEIAIDLPLTEELETAQDLGSEAEDTRFSAAPADQPIAFPLQAFYEAVKQPVPDEYSLYKAYNLWIVPHRVSIIRRRGIAEVTAVGMEVKFDADGGTCCVVSLLPTYKFVERGSLAMRVQVGGNGEAASALGSPLGQILSSALADQAGLSFHGVIEGGAKLVFSASVATPDIQAVGLGSSRSEWRFDRDTEPLYGRDIQCWSILVLPKRRKGLRYSIKYYLNIRTFILSTRRESDWTAVDCRLEPV